MKTTTITCDRCQVEIPAGVVYTGDAYTCGYSIDVRLADDHHTSKATRFLLCTNCWPVLHGLLAPERAS